MDAPTVSIGLRELLLELEKRVPGLKILTTTVFVGGTLYALGLVVRGVFDLIVAPLLALFSRGTQAPTGITPSGASSLVTLIAALVTVIIVVRSTRRIREAIADTDATTRESEKLNALLRAQVEKGDQVLEEMRRQLGNPPSKE